MRLGVTILLSGKKKKTKLKTLLREKKGHCMLKGQLHKKVGPLRRYKNYKYMCTLQQRLKIHRAKADIIDWRNKMFNNNSWCLQYPLCIEQLNRRSDQQGNRNLEYYHKPSGLKKLL